MLTDINGKSELTFFDGTVINNIEELFESVRYRYNLADNNIIGFVKFNSFLYSDNRFCNHLDRNSWYPITNVSHDLYIQLIGVNKTHFGLFDTIVAVNPNNKKIKHIKDTKPRVVKYWARKVKEKNEIITSRIKLEKKRKNLNDSLTTLISDLGTKPSRKATLTSYLKGNFKEERLFLKMKDSKWKSEIVADIQYRLKAIKTSQSIGYGTDLYYLFPSVDNKYKSALLALKYKIENPTVIEIITVQKNGFIETIKNKLMALVA